MVPWSIRLRNTFLAVCAPLLGSICQPVFGAEISGSIRFSDENFSVAVRSTGESLSTVARGCNNFDIAIATNSSGAGLLLRDAKGTDLRSIGYGKVIEVRACGAERYTNEMVFGSPATTNWIPQADAVRGSRSVKYAATLSPAQIRFDPPLALTIFDQSTRARPIKVSGVATIAVRAETSVVYSSTALHFLTAGGAIHRDGGFVAGDEFSLASVSQRFALPEIGRGSEIVFAAPADRPMRLSLYYPIDGPHVLAFYGDDRQQEPTTVDTLRIDGRGLITPELSVAQTGPIVAQRGLFHSLSPREHVATHSMELMIGSAGTDVHDVRIESTDGSIVELSETASGRFGPSLSYPSVPGFVPLALDLRVRVPPAWGPGQYTVPVIVTGEGDLHREIPVTVEVVDPHRTARVVLFATIGVVLIALVLWMLVKRRRVQSREADARVIFFQQHETEYARVRERIEVLLASDPEWAEVDDLLEQFVAKNLQTVLTPQQWKSVQVLSEQRKSREVLEALDRALARYGA